MKRILLIDDDKDYINSIKRVLKSEKHYEIDVSNDAIEILGFYQKGVYDLIIVDYMMPTMNGTQFINVIRKIDSSVRIIMLTGFESDELELEALNLEVNRFIKKGVRGELLLKYVQLELNQQKIETQEKDTMPEKKQLFSKKEQIVVDLGNYTVEKDGEFYSLTNKEYQLLCLFLEHKGVTLERETIINKIWGEKNALVDTRAVDTHIKCLRQKLKLGAIQSIRSVGYKWNE